MVFKVCTWLETRERKSLICFERNWIEKLLDWNEKCRRSEKVLRSAAAAAHFVVQQMSVLLISEWSAVHESHQTAALAFSIFFFTAIVFVSRRADTLLKQSRRRVLKNIKAVLRRAERENHRLIAPTARLISSQTRCEFMMLKNLQMSFIGASLK